MYVNNIKKYNIWTPSADYGVTWRLPNRSHNEALRLPRATQAPNGYRSGIVSRALGTPPRLHLYQAEGCMRPMMEASKSTSLKSSHADCYFMGWSWKPQSMWNPQCQHLLTRLVQITTSWDYRESPKANNMNSQRTIL